MSCCLRLIFFVVLVNSNVSMKCMISPGGVPWLLTKGTARLQAKCVDRLCRVYIWKEGTAVPARSYLVVKMWHMKGSDHRGRSGVAFSRLVTEVLDVFVQMVLPSMRMYVFENACTDTCSACKLWRRMAKGAFLVGMECRCGVEVFCCLCQALDRVNRRWYARHLFLGHYPSKRSPWFTGVTGAVGFIDHEMRLWRLCTRNRRVVRDIHQVNHKTDSS